MSLKRFLTSLSVAVCLGVMAFQAHAQTPPSPIIAIVDVPGVIRKSEAAKTIGAQMETFRTRYDEESRVQSGQRDVQGRLRTLDRAYQGALRKVELKLAEIIEGLATERGVNLVLVASAAVIYTPSMDLSEESLARLNAALPSVTVELTNQ